jgi:hypothetical protein
MVSLVIGEEDASVVDVECCRLVFAHGVGPLDIDLSVPVLFWIIGNIDLFDGIRDCSPGSNIVPTPR